MKGSDVEPITVGNLVIRVDQDGEIGLAKDRFRVLALEELRQAGHRALGAESLAVGKDDSNQARFLLGGTLTELECRDVGRTENCRIAIRWELLDRRSDHIVYEVTTRHTEYGVAEDAQSATSLIRGTVRSLLARPKFVKALAVRETSVEATSQYGDKMFRACPPEEISMPADAERVLAATVLVEDGDSLGSGVLISPDGLLLTAAHVVEGSEAKVQFHDGSVHDARVLRRRADRDVALLAVNGTSASCLTIRPDSPALGAELFAIGSAASKELSFSLTRGIVSGTREWDGVRFLQTDASVNPGNSGGPLVDSQGRIAGIVSWKLEGRGLEGIGFGVPTAAALDALALVAGEATDSSLGSESVTPRAARSPAKIVDAADAALSLDPEGDRERMHWAERARRKRAIDEATPGYVFGMRYAGYAVAGLGAALATYSYVSLPAEKERTYADYSSARTLNDVGFVALGVGVASVVTSYFLVPDLPNERTARSTSARVEADVSLTSMRLRVRY